ncbi:hypothetical protein PROFUN_01548 [Planoprotostelium fungivorum]|uniref:Uncharacterized protein n=1 Tax=Planoprotostelium fungivorum TaxID=1890364 RepID=A0A2P6NTM3_9EUKA|nr:hypothetical protein PROFUN_01548 [Planoprotostelium fungivorum]
MLPSSSSPRTSQRLYVPLLKKAWQYLICGSSLSVGAPTSNSRVLEAALPLLKAKICSKDTARYDRCVGAAVAAECPSVTRSVEALGTIEM